MVFKLTLSFFHCLSSYFISPLLVRSFQNLKCLGDWAGLCIVTLLLHVYNFINCVLYSFRFLCTNCTI